MVYPNRQPQNFFTGYVSTQLTRSKLNCAKGEKTRVIFNIPTDEKLKIQNLPGPHPQRGWSCVGAERTGRLFLSGQGKTDLENVMVDIRVSFRPPRFGSSIAKRWAGTL